MHLLRGLLIVLALGASDAAARPQESFDSGGNDTPEEQSSSYINPESTTSAVQAAGTPNSEAGNLFRGWYSANPSWSKATGLSMQETSSTLESNTGGSDYVGVASTSQAPPTPTASQADASTSPMAPSLAQNPSERLSDPSSITSSLGDQTTSLSDESTVLSSVGSLTSIAVPSNSQPSSDFSLSESHTTMLPSEFSIIKPQESASPPRLITTSWSTVPGSATFKSQLLPLSTSTSSGGASQGPFSETTQLGSTTVKSDSSYSGPPSNPISSKQSKSIESERTDVPTAETSMIAKTNEDSPTAVNSYSDIESLQTPRSVITTVSLSPEKSSILAAARTSMSSVTPVPNHPSGSSLLVSGTSTAVPQEISRVVSSMNSEAITSAYGSAYTSEGLTEMSSFPLPSAFSSEYGQSGVIPSPMGSASRSQTQSSQDMTTPSSVSQVTNSSTQPESSTLPTSTVQAAPTVSPQSSSATDSQLGEESTPSTASLTSFGSITHSTWNGIELGSLSSVSTPIGLSSAIVTEPTLSDFSRVSVQQTSTVSGDESQYVMPTQSYAYETSSPVSSSASFGSQDTLMTLPSTSRKPPASIQTQSIPQTDSQSNSSNSWSPIQASFSSVESGSAISTKSYGIFSEMLISSSSENTMTFTASPTSKRTPWVFSQPGMTASVSQSNFPDASSPVFTQDTSRTVADSQGAETIATRTSSLALSFEIQQPSGASSKNYAQSISTEASRIYFTQYVSTTTSSEINSLPSDSEGGPSSTNSPLRMTDVRQSSSPSSSSADIFTSTRMPLTESLKESETPASLGSLSTATIGISSPSIPSSPASRVPSDQGSMPTESTTPTRVTDMPNSQITYSSSFLSSAPNIRSGSSEYSESSRDQKSFQSTSYEAQSGMVTSSAVKLSSPASIPASQTVVTGLVETDISSSATSKPTLVTTAYTADQQSSKILRQTSGSQTNELINSSNNHDATGTLQAPGSTEAMFTSQPSSLASPEPDRLNTATPQPISSYGIGIDHPMNTEEAQKSNSDSPWTKSSLNNEMSATIEIFTSGSLPITSLAGTPSIKNPVGETLLTQRSPTSEIADSTSLTTAPTIVSPETPQNTAPVDITTRLASRPELATSTAVWTTLIETVSSYTTYCPAPTTVVQGDKTYTITEATTLTITECPCTHTKTFQESVASISVTTAAQTDMLQPSRTPSQVSAAQADASSSLVLELVPPVSTKEPVNNNNGEPQPPSGTQPDQDNGPESTTLNKGQPSSGQFSQGSDGRDPTSPSNGQLSQNQPSQGVQDQAPTSPGAANSGVDQSGLENLGNGQQTSVDGLSGSEQPTSSTNNFQNQDNPSQESTSSSNGQPGSLNQTPPSPNEGQSEEPSSATNSNGGAPVSAGRESGHQPDSEKVDSGSNKKPNERLSGSNELGEQGQFSSETASLIDPVEKQGQQAPNPKARPEQERPATQANYDSFTFAPTISNTFNFYDGVMFDPSGNSMTSGADRIAQAREINANLPSEIQKAFNDNSINHYSPGSGDFYYNKVCSDTNCSIVQAAKSCNCYVGGNDQRLRYLTSRGDGNLEKSSFNSRANLPPATKHLVHSGDTLFLISQRYGVDLSIILAANKDISNPDMILVGQVIQIPAQAYKVVEGDYLDSIAKTYSISLSALEALNDQIKNPDLIFPGQVIKVPPKRLGDPFSTTVEPGDSLSSIADKWSVTLASVEGLNSDIEDKNLIFPNQVVKVPIYMPLQGNLTTTSSCPLCEAEEKATTLNGAKFAKVVTAPKIVATTIEVGPTTTPIVAKAPAVAPSQMSVENKSWLENASRKLFRLI